MNENKSSQIETSPAMEEYLAGVIEVRSTPPLVTLETTSRCNLRCVMCPHAIGAVERPKHLDGNILEKAAPFLKKARRVQLHGIGEPLNSPSFWRVLSLLPSSDICQSTTNTNLTVLTDDQIRKLVWSNLFGLNVSLDAAREDTYRKIRGFSLSTVLHNIERFLAVRRDERRATPKIWINMTLMRSNIEEASEFVELASRLKVERVDFWHLNRYAESEMKRYIIEKENFTFNYSDEGLWNYPALSNRCLAEAYELGQKLGIEVYLDHNKEVFFDE